MPGPTERFERFLAQVPVPAAGAELIVTPNRQGVWRIVHLLATLTTSAAAGSRLISWLATDGTTPFWRASSPLAIGPSSAITVALYPGATGGLDVLPSLDATTVGAATAAGSASLPNGSYTTGFTVDFQGPAAAVIADVTLTNVLGGTQTYRVTIPTTGLLLAQAFNPPLQPATGGVAPTINVPAIAAGPAWSATITGLASPATDGVVSPVSFPQDGITLEQGWQLKTSTFGLDVADQYSLIGCLVEEYPSGAVWWSKPFGPYVYGALDSVD